MLLMLTFNFTKKKRKTGKGYWYWLWSLILPRRDSAVSDDDENSKNSWNRYNKNCILFYTSSNITPNIFTYNLTSNICSNSNRCKVNFNFNIRFRFIFIFFREIESWFCFTGHLSLRRTSSHKIRRRTATVIGGGPGDDNSELAAEMTTSIRKSRNLLGPSSNLDFHRNMRISQRSFDGTVGSSLLVLPSQGSTGRRKSFIHHQENY